MTSISSAIGNSRAKDLGKRAKSLFLESLSYFFDFLVQSYLYRGYIIQSVTRDLRKQYKRSALGYLWSMLNPLLMITVLTIIFSSLLPRVEHYSVFLFSGLISWRYFAGTTEKIMNSIRGNMKLIEQVPMPKFIFPMAIACSNLVDLALTLVALLLVMFVVGRPPTWTVFLFPIYFLPLLLMAIGLGLLLATSNIFFEDTKHLTKITMQAWYYLTPIMYGPEMMSPKMASRLQFNPLFYPVTDLRQIFYYGTVPDFLPFFFSLLLGFAFLLVGLTVFYRNEGKFIYFV